MRKVNAKRVLNNFKKTEDAMTEFTIFFCIFAVLCFAYIVGYVTLGSYHEWVDIPTALTQFYCSMRCLPAIKRWVKYLKTPETQVAYQLRDGNSSPYPPVTF